MTTLLHAQPTRIEIVAPFLYSVTHPEELIGYCEWARRNDRIGDIHSIDDSYGHDIDELVG